MRVDGDAGALQTTLRRRLATATRLIAANELGHARAEITGVLAAQERVSFEEGEWGLAFETIEQFLFASVLLQEGRLPHPQAMKKMIWNPVPVGLAHFLLGQIAIEVREHELAHNELTRSIAENPLDPRAYYELAYTEQRLQNPADGLRHARTGHTYARIPADRAHGLRSAGACCIDLEAMDLAHCFYLEAADLEPGSAIGASQLKYILMESATGLGTMLPDPAGRKAAIGLLGFSSSIDSAHLKARMTLVDILLKQKNVEAAIAQLEDAATWAPEPAPIIETIAAFREAISAAD